MIQWSLLLLAVACSASVEQKADPNPASRTLDLAEILEPVRAEHDLPALAALVLRDGRIVAEGAVGRRRIDAEMPVTTLDPWHLGSCTKSMTATLVAGLVTEGHLDWSTTVGEVFPDFEEMQAAWKSVTLEQLLTNSSGAPNGLGFDGLWSRLWERKGTPTEQRRVLLEGVVSREPDAAPGTKYIYSNAGFSIAGHMAEIVMGTAYEDLLRERVFEPLGMASASFGAPGIAGESSAPFGHFMRRQELQVRELGFGDDNPPGIAPAGLVHCGLRDWSAYAALHLAGSRGESKQLPFGQLHQPRLANYAMGWSVTTPDWCDGRQIWHNGSNTMWYCEIALFPERNLAVLVATNTAHGTTRKGVGGLVRTLYGRFSEETDE